MPIFLSFSFYRKIFSPDLNIDVIPVLHKLLKRHRNPRGYQGTGNPRSHKV